MAVACRGFEPLPSHTSTPKAPLRTKPKLRDHLPLRKPEAIKKTPAQQLDGIVRVEPIVYRRNLKFPHPRRRKRRCQVSDLLRLFDALSLPIQPDMYSSLITECTATGNSVGARDVHARIRSMPPLPILNRLLLMHASCGQPELARQVFDEMVNKGVSNFYSWIVMILAYIESGECHKALVLFASLLKCQNDYLNLPDWFFGYILKACASVGELGLGKQVHALSLKSPSAGIDESYSRSLVGFYWKFRCPAEASLIIDRISCLKSAHWSFRIANNCREGHFHQATYDFREMGRLGFRWNVYDLASMLKASTKESEVLTCGKTFHAIAIKTGVEENRYVQCGIVDMYMKCGLVGNAEAVFDECKGHKNTACWNAMIRGYAEKGYYVEAIKLLYLMEAWGMEAQETLVKDVKMACGSNLFIEVKA